MSVRDSVYAEFEHLQGQVDLIHMSLYVTNNYLQFIVVSIGALTMVAFFLLGYKITAGR